MGNVRELARKIKISGPLRADEPLRDHTSFRIGGPADLYAAPCSAAELAEVLGACRDHPCFLLGGGTNILVSDRGVRGVTVDLTNLRGIERIGNAVCAAAGVPVSAVAEFARNEGLSGLEFAYFLPGSVGGALWMNARCYERSISDVLFSSEYLDSQLCVRRMSMNAADWGYKRSPFQQDGRPILSAAFQLREGDRAAISAEMDSHRKDREGKGHFLYPCAGSVFKNNHAFGAPTGKLIDSLGLKGRRIGDAQIAPFHGNIIVNLGGAAADDVRELMRLMEAEVSAKLGFQLEREVLLVGEW